MRGNAHEAKHPEIVSDVQDLAEMVQRIARKSSFLPGTPGFAARQKKAFRENQHPKYNDPEFGDLNLGGD
jgi:hypothetical protein